MPAKPTVQLATVRHELEIRARAEAPARVLVHDEAEALHQRDAMLDDLAKGRGPPMASKGPHYVSKQDQSFAAMHAATEESSASTAW